MGGIFREGDLVWAKMKGFSPWPGRVSAPTPDMKKPPKKNAPCQWIFFFGTLNYAWIDEPNIKPYFPYKDELIKTSKSASFREAVEQIELYNQDPEKFEESVRAKQQTNATDTDSEFNKLLEKGDIVESPSLIAATSPPKRKRRSEKKTKSLMKNDSQSLPATKRKRMSPTIDNHEDSYPVDEDYTIQRRNASSALLNRPLTVPRTETNEVDMSSISKTLKAKNINPSGLKFGFLGLGIMGCGIVKNLINSGHKVVVWNRTFSKCRKFVEAGAEARQTPSDVVDTADITFSCVSGPQAAKDMVFGNCGVLQASSVSQGKGYVEMTNIDAETSQDIADAIISKGGRFLEAQIQGSKPQAEEGTLIILAAGERTLFDLCQTCFEAMGKNSFYLGDVGNATKMNLVLQVMAGGSIAALGESMALADRAGLQLKDVLEVLELTNMASKMIIEKGSAMIKNEYPTNLPLTHIQKDLRLALNMADNLEQPLPLTATTNEVYKHAKRLGYGDHDASAVYVRAKF
uniref:Cytokine-like nuclear factor N-PAC n=1 Tax=Tabanus bromius TaxID=304241 RepID=A0A0K8TN33_TABBR